MPPTCPKCDRALAKNGFNGSSSQRYRCTACGYSMTDGELMQGRPRHGDEPMSGAEKQAIQRRGWKLQ